MLVNQNTEKSLKSESIAKIKFKLFVKNFKKNWALFRESKMGMFGLWVIIAFGVFGALSPIVLKILDPSIYDPVVGLDSRILTSKYITDYLSTQNLVKGIEIPSAQLWVYSFMDKGEAFKSSMENLVRNSQYEIMTTYAPDSLRHLLDTIADSYIPAKERIYFQTSVSELVEKGLITFSAISSAKDIGNRDKFSFQDFSELLQKVDYETLAKALSPYVDSDEVSRATLWFRSLNRDKPEVVEEFNRLLNQQFSEDEIKSAQEKVLNIAKSVADVSATGQLYIQSDSQFSEVIQNDIVPVEGLVNAAVFNILPELIVLSKEHREIEEAISKSKFSNLFEIAKEKLANFSNKEVFDAALNKANKTIATIEEEMKNLGLNISYKDVDQFLETYAGIRLAKVSVDLSLELRAKLENNIADYSSVVRKGFVFELNDIFMKIALARSFMAVLLDDENIPENYEYFGSKVIKVLSEPISSLMAYAFQETGKLDKVIQNIENSQLDDFRRLDIVEKLKTYKEP
ncbi:MAG: ABC transporter permease, partial [Fervidobacterium sp.]